MNSHDLADEVLILLGDILASCDRVLARAGHGDPRLAEIRADALELERLLLDYWAVRARDADDDPQMHLDELLDDEPDF